MTARNERFHVPDAGIRIDQMPADGRDLKVEVAESDRAELAAFLDVTTIEHLKVALHAVRFRGGIRVTGRLDALVVQPSVVTLEPVRQTISEPIDRVFLPGGERPYAGAANAKIFVDLEGEDLPDHFEGNEADLSDLLVETLALAIDLYPRGDNESLPTDAVDPEAKENPFAVLAKLRGDDGSGGKSG